MFIILNYNDNIKRSLVINCDQITHLWLTDDKRLEIHFSSDEHVVIDDKNMISEFKKHFMSTSKS